MTTTQHIALIALAYAAVLAGWTWATQIENDGLACIPALIAGTAAVIVAWRLTHRRHRV